MLCIAHPKAVAVILAMATLPVALSPALAAETAKPKNVSSAVVTREAGVKVVRGRTNWHVAPASKSPATLAVHYFAGKRLWLVDRHRDRVTACRSIRSSRVGRDRIRCTTRRLPN